MKAKTLCLLVLPAILVLVAGRQCFPQTNAGTSPPFEILKLKWEKQIRLPRNFDPSVIPTNGGFTDPAKAASSAASPPTSGFESSPAVSFPAAPGRLPVVFVYSLRIRNTSNKVIEGVAWDYVFMDPRNSNEVGRRQFVSFETIPAGKNVTFNGIMQSSPPKVVQLHDRQKTEIRMTESASIQCLLYADYTIWKNPSARRGICELLATQRSLWKRRRAKGAQ